MKLIPLAFLAAATAAIGVAQRDSKDLITQPQLAAPQSTEITSDSMEMASTDTETRGVFIGNVVVTGTNLKLTCDRLEILATQIGDKTATVGKLDKFKTLLATGHVRIVQGDREATCGRAEVFPREERIVLKDNPMVTDHGNDSKVVGTELRLLRGERRVQGDNVRVILPEIKDLGFDKNQPAPKADGETASPAAPSPTTNPTPPAATK